jgi:hypothetical protein
MTNKQPIPAPPPPPTDLPVKAVEPDLLALAEHDPEKALNILQAQQAFHRPTRRRHAAGSGKTEMRLAEDKEKKRRKMAKASEKANRKHANKKKRPTGSKRRK